MHVLAHLIFQKSMRKKNKNLKKVVFVCSLIALAAGYFFWFKPKYNQATAIKASTTNAIEVSVVTAKKDKVQLYLELPGRVESHKISNVRPQINGVIKKIKFVEGSFVKQGQQLYQIDPIVYLEALKSANSNLKALKAKRDRYKNLLAQDAVSKQDFDDISASYAEARSQAELAKKNFEYTKVMAPISGYIGKSNFTEGSLVTANQEGVLTTITQLDPIYVDMAQPTKDMMRLRNQKELVVTLITEDPTYSNTGKLKFSEMFADESTDSVRLRSIFSNQDQKLIPGMFVTGKIHLQAFDAVTVPQRSTTRGSDGSLTIWIIDKENTAKPRKIKADEVVGDSWIVNEGLEDGETVVYEGFQKLAEGAKVNPTPFIKQEMKQ